MSILEFHAVHSGVLNVQEASLGPGCHTILAESGLGTEELVALAVGYSLPHKGTVRVSGRAPGRTPALRRRIGALLAEPDLPAAVDVATMLTLVDALRGGKVLWSDVLAQWGIAELISRQVQQLNSSERRALALVIALTTQEPIVIALHNPFEVEALDPDRIASAIIERSEACCVVITAASVRDAARVPGPKWLLLPGRIDRVPEALLDVQNLGAQVSLRVLCEQPRLLLSALAQREEVLALAWNGVGGSSEIWARGRDAAVLSTALLEVACDCGAGLLSWDIVASTIPELRAAHEGWQRGAYDRGWHAAHSGAGAGAPIGPEIPGDGSSISREPSNEGGQP